MRAWDSVGGVEGGDGGGGEVDVNDILLIGTDVGDVVIPNGCCKSSTLSTVKADPATEGTCWWTDGGEGLDDILLMRPFASWTMAEDLRIAASPERITASTLRTRGLGLRPFGGGMGGER